MPQTINQKKQNQQNNIKESKEQLQHLKKNRLILVEIKQVVKGDLVQDLLIIMKKLKVKIYKAMQTVLKFNNPN